MDGQTLCPLPLQVTRRGIHSVTLLWYVFRLREVFVDSLPVVIQETNRNIYLPHGKST
jgi:hypothetical protein